MERWPYCFVAAKLPGALYVRPVIVGAFRIENCPPMAATGLRPRGEKLPFSVPVKAPVDVAKAPVKSRGFATEADVLPE